jgi:hypothetical protein
MPRFDIGCLAASAELTCLGLFDGVERPRYRGILYQSVIIAANIT